MQSSSRLGSGSGLYVPDPATAVITVTTVAQVTQQITARWPSRPSPTAHRFGVACGFAAENENCVTVRRGGPRLDWT